MDIGQLHLLFNKGSDPDRASFAVILYPTHRKTLHSFKQKWRYVTSVNISMEIQWWVADELPFIPHPLCMHGIRRSSQEVRQQTENWLTVSQGCSENWAPEHDRLNNCLGEEQWTSAQLEDCLCEWSRNTGAVHTDQQTALIMVEDDTPTKDRQRQLYGNTSLWVWSLHSQQRGRLLHSKNTFCV